MNQSTSHTKKRNVVLYLMLLVMTIICIGCKPDNGEASTMNTTTQAGSMAGKKVAIVYYSWSGHTKAVANKIHARTGGGAPLGVAHVGAAADEQGGEGSAQNEVFAHVHGCVP